MAAPSPLYPILDISAIEKFSSADELPALAAIFFRQEIQCLQLRAKDASSRQTLMYASAIRNELHAEATLPKGVRHSSECRLILNDRADLALLAGFDGCHLGQDDLSIAGSRKIMPRPKLLGLSTHNALQVAAGNETDADYLAIGPVFITTSKSNAEPAIGLAEFARLRKLTGKPVVAIGGITRHNAKSVLDAGADSVVIIGDLYTECTSTNFTSQLERNLADILARIL